MIEGWLVDAMEQLLGQLMVMQRQKDLSVEELAEMLMDKSTGDGTVLSDDEHRRTMAVCMAIMLRRLAVIDVPA